MDFDLKETMEDHCENCTIAMPQPGEEHLDHTYSKGFPIATSVKLTNLFSSDQGNLFRGIVKLLGAVRSESFGQHVLRIFFLYFKLKKK